MERNSLLVGLCLGITTAAVAASCYLVVRGLNVNRKVGRISSKWRLPSHIILLRHGESKGNVNEKLYSVIADHKIPLTERGKMQARLAAQKMIGIIGRRKCCIYYSPYMRTVETFEQLLSAIPTEQVYMTCEEARIREQDFGNFQKDMKEIKTERHLFGRFFFRFPNGESGADVYDRVSSFFETLFRQFKRTPISRLSANDEYVLIIVSHGITLRVFLMRWFHWTVNHFDRLHNPPNCVPIVMRRRPDMISYELETLEELGLTEKPGDALQYPVRHCGLSFADMA